jgi:transcriptional regulator GlxA family with amidase domain
MPRHATTPARNQPLHVSVVALPESILSKLIGLYEVFDTMRIYASLEPAFPREPCFHAEIVSPAADLRLHTSDLPLRAHRTIDQVDHTDIIIVPPTLIQGEWVSGRYPELVGWLLRMHAAGAELCSACSGALLLAETRLWNGREATLHWAFARTFAKNFPEVKLRLREVLVVTGSRGELITSGAATAWHDLALFLVARHVGPIAAQALARFMLMEWHADGQGPYVAFSPRTDHDDRVIRELQIWLEDNYAVPRALEELVKRSGLPERTLKRRFTRATDLAPIAYLQRLRVEEAKRRLERTDSPVEEVSQTVGYEDPAFFRRLFKRLTDVTPGEYRRKFRIPDFVRTRDAAMARGNSARMSGDGRPPGTRASTSAASAPSGRSARSGRYARRGTA